MRRWYAGGVGGERKAVDGSEVAVLRLLAGKNQSDRGGARCGVAVLCVSMAERMLVAARRVVVVDARAPGRRSASQGVSERLDPVEARRKRCRGGLYTLSPSSSVRSESGLWPWRHKWLRCLRLLA